MTPHDAEALQQLLDEVGRLNRALLQSVDPKFLDVTRQSLSPSP
jgi:hypothetical protein